MPKKISPQESPAKPPVTPPVPSSQSSRRRRWKLVGFVALLLVVIGLAYVSHLRQSVVVARSNGNLPVALGNKSIPIGSLSKEGDSRLNIMLLGQGGPGHDGPDLTDTMQVASLDLVNKQISLLSVPRDLYVKTTYGSMKINALYQSANAAKKDSGGQAVKDFVGGITDFNIHYFIAIDFDGFKELVDTLGGVDINVKNPINDPEYPNAQENGVVTFKLNAGQQHMNGDLALKYARSRHSFGAEGSDFARSARQQLLIAAVRDKAAQLGYFKNPLKFVQLTNLLAKFVKTDITPSEMQLLAERLADINTQNIQSAVLSNSPTGLLTDGTNQYTGYTLVPIAGANNYADIARLFHRIAPDPLLKKEAAKVRVLYPASKAKAARDTVALLADYGYTVVSSEALPASTKAAKQATLVDYRNNKYPYTLHYLANRFQAAVTTAKAVRDDVDIDLTLGQ